MSYHLDDNFAVFLSNLSPDSTSDRIRHYMDQAGPVKRVRRGAKDASIAIVHYSCLSDAVRAVELLDGSIFFRRRLFVQIHKDNT